MSYIHKAVGAGLIGLVAFILYTNAPLTPPEFIGDQKVITPNVPIELIEKPSIRGEKGNVVIKHNATGDTLKFDVFDSYLLLPDGQTSLPTKPDATGKEQPVWTITPTRPISFINLGNDFGMYAGVLFGRAGSQTRTWDAGIKYSPVRVLFNTTSIDFLASDQSAGIGVAVYPAPERYGYFWRHVGLGFGRVYNFNDDGFSNLTYVTVSTRF